MSTIRLTALAGGIVSTTNPPAQSSSSEPVCFLLEIGQARILLDCGCWERHSEFATSGGAAADEHSSGLIETLERLAPSLTLVLLSQASLAHIGLLPLLVSRLGLPPSCLIYASPPTKDLGRIALDHWVRERQEEEDAGLRKTSASLLARTRETGSTTPVTPVERATTPTSPSAMSVSGSQSGDEDLRHMRRQGWQVSMREVREAFDRIRTIRWSSPLHLEGRNAPLTLLAQPSGTHLGGTLFFVRSPTMPPILYAPVFNHIKEKHLDSAASIVLGGAETKGLGTLITSVEKAQSKGQKTVARNSAMLQTITSTLQAGRSVLMPVDAAGRIAELLVLLDQHWTFSHLGDFPLCLVSPTGPPLQMTLRNLHEFFGSNLGKEGIGRLANLKIFPSLDSLYAVIPPHVPKVVLAAPLPLSYGSSRKVFTEMAAQAGNLLLLTSPGPAGSLSRSLFDKWNEAQTPAQRMGTGEIGQTITLNEAVSLPMRSKVILQGEELQEFLDNQRAAKERHAKQKAMLERSQRMAEADADASDSEDGDSSDEDELEAPNAGEILPQQGDNVDVMAEPGARRDGEPGSMRGTGVWDEFLDEDAPPGTLDVYVRGRSIAAFLNGMPDTTSSRLRMYPFTERRRKVDAYGEVIDVQGWLRRGRNDEEEQEENAMNNALLGKRKRQQDEQVEPPHKFLIEERQVMLRCQLFAVDLEGRADGRALKDIIPRLAPKRLILVNGSSAAAQDIARACHDFVPVIEAPALGERVIAGIEIQSFAIRLGDELLSSLKLSKVEEYEMARISGILRFVDGEDIPTLEPSLAQAAISEDLLVDGADTEMTKKGSLAPLKPSMFIGDVKLAALRQRLLSAKIQASFAGAGVLVCGPVQSAADTAAAAAAKAQSKQMTATDPRLARLTKANKNEPTPDLSEPVMDTSGGRVAVRKRQGHLVIEGAAGDTLYAVRDVIYALHGAA